MIDTSPEATQRIPAWETRFLLLLRRVFVVGASALTAGVVVAGIGGRIAMRVSAIAAGPRLQGVTTDAGNRVGEITLGGSVAFVLFTGIFGGVAAGWLLLVAYPWLRGRGRSVLAGLFLLAVGGTTVIHESRDFLLLDPPLLNVVMYASIVAGVGWAALALAARFEARLPDEVSRRDYLWLVVVLFALVPSPILFGGFFSDELCQCGEGSPGPLVGVFVLIALAATLVFAGYRLAGRGSPSWLRIVGTTAVVAAASAGAVRLMEEVQAIL